MRRWATSLAWVLPGLSAGCSADEAAPSDDYAERVGALGVEVPTCSQPASSGFDNQTKTLSIQMTAGTPTVIVAVQNGLIAANGYPCVKKTADGGATLAPSAVKKVSVLGTGASGEKVVLDFLGGSFGGAILSTTGGIVVDLGAGTSDELALRGGSAAEKWTGGQLGTDLYFELSGDTVADLKVSRAETVTVALGAGNDVFSGRGGALNATHLVGATTTMLDPLSVDLTVDGGEGDDTLNGGDGDDELSGGGGNDVFKTHSSADGADSYAGGAGLDKLDYGARTAGVTAIADGATSSGAGASMQGASATEGDTIAADIEDLAGGSGDDYLVGNGAPNRLTGNAGNDWLSGGPAGDCSVDVDVLDGGAGDDRFLQGASADCADSMLGGVGVDRADYQQRTGNVLITLEGTPNDGESGEADNVKTDVEQVLGGGGDDVITGSSNGDELHGGPGADVLTGGAGNDVLIGDGGNDVLNGDAGSDTFLESGVDDAYSSGSEQRGAGGDTMNGGTPVAGTLDRADYGERSADLVITLCTDTMKAKGGSTAHAQCTDSDGAGEGDSVVNVQHLVGGSGEDDLRGHTGDETLEGGGGADTLSGGAGSDRLFGDAGDDQLFGDGGDDYLDGVAGADTLDGDRGSNGADGDVCLVDAADTAANCEL
jgi:Ca2+-binding RTX toxin-like protein